MSRSAVPLHGLCFSSCLQVSALHEFLPWLPSQMICDKPIKYCLPQIGFGYHCNRNLTKTTTPNIVIKLLKTSDKEKKWILYKKSKLQIIFCQKFYKLEDKIMSSLKYWEKNCQDRVLHLGKVAFRNEGTVKRNLISSRQQQTCITVFFHLKNDKR